MFPRALSPWTVLAKRFQPVCLAVFVLGITGAPIGCKRISAHYPVAPVLTSDSLQLIQVREVNGQILTSGQPSHFLVRMAYSLQSHDSAFLVLSLDQFVNVDSCVPTVTDESRVKTVASQRIPIERGLHTIEIPIEWPGDIGSSAQNRVSGKGTISLEAAMWSEKPTYKFLAQWFGTQFCQRF